MQDQDFMAVLASHGAANLGKCFLVKDVRTGGYSVGVFDRNGKPFLLTEDDENFNDALADFLREKKIKVYENISELTK